MMGRTHAALGGLAGLGVGVAFDPADPVRVLAAGAVAAGAALLPDLDHEDSTVAHVLGPVTRGLARVVHRATGGHRHGTHALLSLPVAAGLTAGLDAVRVGGVPVAVGVVGLALAGAARALLPRWLRLGRVAALGGAGVATWELLRLGWLTVPWVTALVVGGWASHLAGDALTQGGVPALLPFEHRWFAWPVLGHTGSSRETAVRVALLLGLVLACWPLVGHATVTHIMGLARH